MGAGRGGGLLVAPRRSQHLLLALALVTAFLAAVAVTVAGADRSHRPLGEAAGAQPLARAQRPAAAVPGPPARSAPGAALLGFTGGAAVTAPASHKPAPAPKPTMSPPSQLASGGIPATALYAYRNAARLEAAKDPGCHLPWPLLAGIGRVESDHGRFAGAVLHADGTSTPRIVGIPLDGNATALIRDTDHGRLDGDTTYDRAVGPMQFIPSTWAGWGRDANHDGVRDPFNIIDAAAASADYLCAAGRDLSTYAGQVAAVLSYNHSDAYVSEVLGLEKIYAHQVGVTIPIIPTDPAAHPARHVRRPTLPPVDPGPPRALVPPARTPTAPPSAPPTSSAPSSPVTSTPAGPSTGDSTDVPADPGDPGDTGTPADPGTSDPADPGTSDPADPPSDDPTDPAGTPAADATDTPAGDGSTG